MEGFGDAEAGYEAAWSRWYGWRVRCFGEWSINDEPVSRAGGTTGWVSDERALYSSAEACVTVSTTLFSTAAAWAFSTGVPEKMVQVLPRTLLLCYVE